MANPEHLEIFGQGAKVWNSWRIKNPSLKPDLSNTWISYPTKDCPDHTGSNLTEVDFSRSNIMGPDRDWPDETAPCFNNANFAGAFLRGIEIFRVSMNGANFQKVSFHEATLKSVGMHGCNLRDTYFEEARLNVVDMNESNLEGATLENASFRRVQLQRSRMQRTSLRSTSFIDVDLRGASITDCYVYGTSLWDAQIDDSTKMGNLIITNIGMNPITVDNLELAQFVYLLLNNERIRNVIDTITSKVVLILGRFIEQRKRVLDALRIELRERGYTPILFDFEKPQSRDLTETISTLAHMARFIIADITDAKSIPQELQVIVPNLPSVPVQPLLLASEYEYGMFEHFKRYPWVLKTHLYNDLKELLISLPDKVINPAESKAKELQANE